MPMSPKVVVHGLCICAVGIFAVAPATSHATVVKALSLIEKTEVAPVILYGTVERIETDWVVPGSRMETRITLSVIEALKGAFEPNERVTFRRGGGKIGEIEQTAPGLSQYEVGEQVIMFLEPLGATYVAIGIGIGKYEVELRGAGKFVNHNPDVATARYDEMLQKPMTIDVHEAMTPEPLPAFLKRLRSYVRGFKKPNSIDPRRGLEIKPRPEVTPLSR